MTTQERNDLKEELKPYLKQYADANLEKSKGNFYVCPYCNSGTGEHQTGAFSLYANNTRYKCQRCGKTGDLYELIEKLEGLNYPDAFNKACELFRYNQAKKPIIKTKPAIKKEACTDYTNFFLQANNNIHNTDYATKRGLSSETINKYKLGYIEAWKHPKAPNGEPIACLIIPTSKHSYTARSIQGKEYKKVNNELFNIQALTTANTAIFVVEGELDALSIIETGQTAIALGSTSMIHKFITEVQKQKQYIKQPLLIALDNDEAGQAGNKKLLQELNNINVKAWECMPYMSYKDANECLVNAKDNFINELDRALIIPLEAKTEADQEAEEQDQEAKEEYFNKNNIARNMMPFIETAIGDNSDNLCISTGFERLDAILDGGLYAGLYGIGAISSLGKTTFVMQIADHIASTGQDVLIFSLEMARFELMARSISRETYKINKHYASTLREITNKNIYNSLKDKQVQVISDAYWKYGDNCSNNLYIFEGVGDIGAKDIRETVEKHIKYTGNRPVIIIDYLQILAPYSEKLTEQQTIDKSVLELKRLSRDKGLPVIIVTSFNRQSYNNKANMAQAKGSGAIEYSTDVLMTLQVQNINQYTDTTKEKRRKERQLELVILKNRNGELGEPIGYKSVAKYNHFNEAPGQITNTRI